MLFQVTGKCGSVLVRLIPAPRGTGIVSAPVPKKLLQMAGVEDCYTSAVGQTATLGNFAKVLSKFVVPNRLELPRGMLFSISFPVARGICQKGKGNEGDIFNF